MQSLRTKSKPSRAHRSPHGWTALASCVVLAACAGAPESGKEAGADASASRGEHVAQSSEALNYCPNPTACTSPADEISKSSSDTKQILTVAKDALNFVADASASTVNPAKLPADTFQTLIDLFFGSSPDVAGAINCLNQEVQCVAQGLDWKINAVAWSDDQYDPVSAALMDMPPGPGFTTGSDDDWFSHTGTLDSGQLDMFSRIYVPSSTDGDGQWKKTISNSGPISTGSNQAFDWQAGFSRFTALVSRRLAIMAYLDPNFSLDGTRNGELEVDQFGNEGYRYLLRDRLNEMLDGVRCDTKDRFVTDYTGDGDCSGSIVEYQYTDIACADVNSGISAETTYAIPNANSCQVWSGSSCPDSASFDYNCLANLASQSDIGSNEDILRREVLAQMPVFEVHSMIDSLRRLTHPSVPDLTEGAGRIPLAANTGLCLDVPYADPTPGTPVQLYYCNGGAAQQWHYDRKAQTIVNSALGKCLQVRQSVFNFWGTTFTVDNRSAGALAEISDCVSPPPARQQWTYDPEQGIIRSALGTVLDVQWNNQQAGTPVWLWDENDGSAQQWYSDRSNDYCNSICQEECVGDGPGTGACVGGCVGGCMAGATP